MSLQLPRADGLFERQRAAVAPSQQCVGASRLVLADQLDVLTGGLLDRRGQVVRPDQRVEECRAVIDRSLLRRCESVRKMPVLLMAKIVCFAWRGPISTILRKSNSRGRRERPGSRTP